MITNRWFPLLIDRRFLTLAIAGLVLLLSLYLGWRGTVSQYTQWLAGLVVFVCFVVLLRQIELGLVGILIAGLCIPYVIKTSSQYTSLNLAVVGIGGLVVVWLAEMFRRRSVGLAPSQVNAPVLAFAASATVSLIVGQLPWNYFARYASILAQLGGWALFILSLALFLLVGNLTKDLRWLKWITILFLLIGSIAVLGGFLPFFSTIIGRLIPIGATGSLLWVWVAAISGGLALFDSTLRRRWRIALAVLALLTFGQAWLINRSWASGWLPVLAAIVTLIWLRSWRIGTAITLLALVALLVYRPDFLQSLYQADKYSTVTRIEAAEIILGKVLPANPITGLGPSNYYYFTRLYPIRGYYVVFNSHNQYVDIIAQLGFVGILIFVWLIFSIGNLGWKLRQRVDDGFARGYVHACLAGLVGTLVAGMLGDWFIPFVYNIGFDGFRASMLGWLFLGGLVAIEQLVKQKADPAATAH